MAEGDANTRFFHLQACHRSRKNYIASISVEGLEVVQDIDKGNAVYQYYNAILGSSFERSSRFELSTLGLPSLNLSDLETLFSEDEVWRTINSLPNDKAPGPDGFTVRFYKKTWGVIKHDILEAFNAFWAMDMRSFHLLNDAYVVLLKKKEQAAELKDYRPISLIHSFGKLVTKCLANRLASKLGALVCSNQSTFIKGRSIHDNSRTVQQSCKLLHARRSPFLLMKVDIAKAFYTVSWPFLLDVLQHMGFAQRWRDWMATTLGSASTKVLLNGRPGRRICHARGLRQGDPLSPMLFVLAIDVLNRLLQWLDANSFFSPLNVRAIPCHASFYADDLVLFVVPSGRDL